MNLTKYVDNDNVTVNCDLQILKKRTYNMRPNSESPYSFSTDQKPGVGGRARKGKHGDTSVLGEQRGEGAAGVEGALLLAAKSEPRSEYYC